MNQTTDIVNPNANLTVAEKFAIDVQRRFAAEMGTAVAWTQAEGALAQHLYLYLDAHFKELDKKRDSNKPPITWSNMNMVKLTIDTTAIVALGLDAQIKNMVHALPFLNGRTGKYDVLLLRGYAGVEYIARKYAFEPVKDILVQLVYSTDHFVPIHKDINNPIESYEFRVINPFNRGEVTGGFGYISYDDPSRNRLILVTPRDFNRSQGSSKSQFWRDHDVEMKYKTVWHRVCSKIGLDPTKINVKALDRLEEAEIAYAKDVFDEEVSDNANSGPTIELPQNAEVVSSEAAPEPAEDDAGF